MMSSPHGEGLWELLFKGVVRNDQEDQVPGAHVATLSGVARSREERLQHPS